MPSLAISLAALTLVAQALAHVSLVSIYGSNGAVGHGFGVNLNGKYPREKGIPGDAGGDSGIFQTGTDNPSPPCGRTPELGPIDLLAWLDQAEGSGLPAAYANMSVIVDAFQVNRDGGGPMSCEYNEDATAATWKPMFMSLNQAGNSGIQNQVRTNETVIMNFPEGAKCTGGWTQTACIVRCRTGVNKRFGGCFAVKLADSSAASVTSVGLDASLSQVTPIMTQSGAQIGNDTTTLNLTEEQISFIVDQVILQMKKDGLVLSASTLGSIGSATGNLNATALSQISQGIQLDSNHSSPLTDGSSNQTLETSTNTTSLNATADASDLADNRLYTIANATGSSQVAAEIVDNQALNLTAPVEASANKHHKHPRHLRRCEAHKSNRHD